MWIDDKTGKTNLRGGICVHCPFDVILDRYAHGNINLEEFIKFQEKYITCELSVCETVQKLIIKNHISKLNKFLGIVEEINK